MQKKWALRLLLLFSLLIIGGIVISLFYLDDLRPANIESHHVSEKKWDTLPLSDQENQFLDSILGQNFSYLGEGGQSYVFMSSDEKHVLKLFKFRRFRPSPLVSFIPDITFLSRYREKHTDKRHLKWLAAFTGHQLAYETHRHESGLVYIQLNSGLDRSIEVMDKWGFKRSINLKNTPFVLQEKGETLGSILSSLLAHKDVQKAEYKIDQLFDLYLSEYRKGIHDIDYGVMHNIGVIGERLIHLDVGKMVRDERMKNPSFYHTDLTKVAEKVYSWVEQKYPESSAKISRHIENKLSELFGRRFYLTRAGCTEECKNIFSSPTYTDYDRQRKKFLSNHQLYKNFKPPHPMEMGIENLIHIIEKPLSKHPHEQRKHHIAFINEVRRLSKVQLKDEKSRQLFEDVIRWTFLGANLESPMESFLYQDGLPSAKDLPSFVTNTFKTVRENPQFNGVKHPSSFEDQFLEGNLPSTLAVVNNTTLIRMGQPAGVYRSFSWFYTPSIFPEFIQFLKLQPSHLYVNLMKRHGKEGAITHSIESLEKQIHGLYVVTLDKNTPFYWQDSEKDPEIIGSEEFKNHFLNEMFSHGSGFYWSVHLNQSEWKQELKEILSEVHKDYFTEQIELNRTQRQDFIELTYLKILDHLVDKWNPASMNISCRQCIDRGPSLSTLWLLEKNLFDNREITALLLAPPLVIHNRPGYSNRVNRFLSAAKALQDFRDPISF